MSDLVECSKCGNMLPAEIKDCPHCGNGDLMPEVAQNNNSPTRKIGSQDRSNITFETGDKISKYQLRNQLGRGGYGEVWEVSTEQKQKLALKIIQVPDGKEPAKMIRDYHILRNVHDFTNLIRYENPELVSVNGEEYLLIPMSDVMEGNLDDYKAGLKGLSFPKKERIVIEEILPQICNGLKVLHNSGIVHHDIKPGNILYSGSNFKLADFGTSSIINPALYTTADTSEQITGTLRYISPEQAAGRSCDIRSDIFSLGITLCELLFDEPYPVEVPGVTPSLMAFLNRFIAPAPGNRFQSVDEILFYNRKNSSKAGIRQKTENSKTKKRRRFLLIFFVFLIVNFIILYTLGINYMLKDFTGNYTFTVSSDVSVTEDKYFQTEIAVIESASDRLLLKDPTHLTAKEIVKRYMEVNAWGQRLSYVLYPETVKSEMQNAYKNVKFPLTFNKSFHMVSVKDIKGPDITDDDIEVILIVNKEIREFDYYTMMDPGYGELQFMYVLQNTDYGWRVDWENRSIPDSPTEIEVLKIERPEAVQDAVEIFAFIKLGDSYYWQYSDREKEFYPFEIYITDGEMFDYIDGYAEKSSAHGKALYNIVRNSKWPVIPVTLKVAYVTKTDEYGEIDYYDTSCIDIVSFEHTYFY